MIRLAKKITLAALGLVTILSLASCSSVDPNTITHEAITAKCQLKKDFAGKDFFEDGIEEVVSPSPTDGDTASFTTVSNKPVTVRFYAIDTPESTGGVEKWGKAASNFTKGILLKATSIVLEASQTPAVVDSYGSRYLAYVWYKLIDDDEYKNLNLQIVENGYSTNKSKSTDSYSSYFKEAENFAKKNLLHIWNDNLEDPDFSTEATEVTLKELTENITQYYDAEKENGLKVRFVAYVKSYYVSGTEAYTYKVAQVIDGVEYTFDVYAGYNSSGIPGYVCVGTEYSFTGPVQKHGSNYQISGITYVAMKTGGDYLYSTRDNYYLQFSDDMEYNIVYYRSLYTAITVSSASVNDTTLTITGQASLKKKNGEYGDSTTFTIKCPVEAGFDASIFNGSRIVTYGCVEDGVVSVLSSSDIFIL